VPSKLFDAEYWLDAAEEARKQAEEMTHPPAKREMLLIAAKILTLGPTCARTDGAQKITRIECAAKFTLPSRSERRRNES
jgi:hypothetical protein